MRTLLLIALCLVFSSIPLASKAQQILVNDKYINKLESNIRGLNLELSKTKDPKKKIDIVRRLNSLYEAYNHPDIRLHLIGKKYPKYAARIIRTRNMTDAQKEDAMNKDYNRRVEMTKGRLFQDDKARSPWPLLSKAEKVKVCLESLEMCLEGEDYKYCHFVIDKCRGFIDEKLYKQASDKLPY